MCDVFFVPTHPPNKEERRPKDGVVKENQAEDTANGGVQQLTRTQAAGGFRGSAGDGRGRSRRFSNSRSGGRGGRGDGAGDAGGGGGGDGRPHHTARGERERQHQQAASNPAQQARESSGQCESQDATAQPAAPRRAWGEAAAAGEAQTTSNFGDNGERAKGGWEGRAETQAETGTTARGYHGLGVRERPLRRSGETPHASAPVVLNLWAEYRARES